MSGDPFAIFANESESKRELIKTLWPELYTCLARLDEPRRAWGCAQLGHEQRYAEAVGRLWLNGPPACAEHLKASKRPGGFPMKLINPKEWTS